MSPAPRSRSEVWSRYWAQGALHSCVGSLDNEKYDGAIGAFWGQVYRALPVHARVLDIATGNGALPKLLLTARADRLECHAIDLARITPAWQQALPAHQRDQVHFHSGVSAEALPFEHGSFALVTSQYGVEYSDLARSVPEMLRVLAPGGEIALVCHHAGSVPVALAADEIGHIDWLLAEGGLLDAASGMLRPMAMSANAQGRAALATDADAHKARALFDARAGLLRTRGAASACPDVLFDAQNWLAQVFAVAVQQGETEAGKALAGVTESLLDARLRLFELREHALDDDAALHLQHELAAGEVKGRFLPLHDAGRLMGWAFRGCRP